MTTKPLLFTPVTVQDVTLKNRVVIAPMATYSAVDGIAQDFHFAHLGRLALGGAACVFVEATAVTAQGRITNGDMGAPSPRSAPTKRQAGGHCHPGLARSARAGTQGQGRER